MSLKPNIAARFNELDKAALVELTNRLQMNQTQVLRTLVRETLAVLKEQEATTINDKSNIVALANDTAGKGAIHV